MKYARVLLEHCPKSATQLFIDYYTGQYRPKQDAVVIDETKAPTGGYGGALSNLASFLPLPYMNTSGVETPASRNQENTISDAHLDQSKLTETPADYDVPKPRTAFSSFVDHPDEFIIFLEACLKQDDLKTEDKIDLYTTLFEMYLEIASNKEGEEKTTWETKAKRLIEGKDVSIDPLRRSNSSTLMSYIRSRSIYQTCFFSLIYRTTRTVLSWCASRQACDRTSSGLIRRPKTPLGRSKL